MLAELFGACGTRSPSPPSIRAADLQTGFDVLLNALNRNDLDLARGKDLMLLLNRLMGRARDVAFEAYRDPPKDEISQRVQELSYP